MAHKFSIHPLSRFEQAGQTTIRRPREFLCFSFDDKHDLKPFSNDSLRYYYPPFVQAPGTDIPPVDLSRGFESRVDGDDSVDNHLNGLLDTIQAHEKSLVDTNGGSGDAITRVDIVTWRGMMTKIMTAPFDIFSDFEMNATCYQGTIYIEENHSYKLADELDQKKKPPRPGEFPQELMQYWGRKFESLSVLQKPWGDCTREEIDSRDKEIVNSNTQYCSIVRTGIGTTSLNLGGEIDCVMGDKPDNLDEPIPWVELKTSAEPPNDSPRERQKFERKLLKFWAQSFLLGVPRIIVGFRTQKGILTRIQEFETQKLPGIVSRGEGTWDGNVCIKFTAVFLEFLKETMAGQEGVWRIQRKRNSPEIAVFRVEENGTGKIIKQDFKDHRARLIAVEIAPDLVEKTLASRDGA